MGDAGNMISNTGVQGNSSKFPNKQTPKCKDSNKCSCLTHTKVRVGDQLLSSTWGFWGCSSCCHPRKLEGVRQFRDKCPILTSETEVAHITFVHIPLVWTLTKCTPLGCKKSWKIHSPPGYPHRNYNSVTIEEEDLGGQMAIAMAVCPSGHHVPTLIPK